MKRKEKSELPELQISSHAGFNYLSSYPKPNSLFTGRKKEINEFKKTFNSSRIFAIEGLGGTGKTQFAAKCIEEAFNHDDKIVWLDGSSQSNFDVFVENAGYGDVLKGEKKTDLSLYSGLKDLIEKDKTIIFWDNYNDYDDLSFSKFLSFAYPYLQKASIILLTKVEPSIERITTLPIVRLEGLEEDAIIFAKRLKASNRKYDSVSETDLIKICNGVEGHPLAIEFSMYLMGYGKSADDIMLHMSEYSGIKKVEDFSKRLFLDILYHPNTTTEERECFLRCSVFKERINEEGIKFLYDGNNVFGLLAGLIDKLLITSKEGFYEMHPLVRSFSYEKLIDKESVHKKAADYYISLRVKTLNASLEEKIFYHLSEAKEWERIANSIETIGPKFIQQGQLGLIIEFMNKLVNLNVSRPVFEILYGDIAQIKGEWNGAIRHFIKASQNIENSKVKVEGIIKHGEILFRRGDLNESLSFFENAYQLSKTQSFRKEEARALNDIGLVNIDFNELDIAYRNLSAALKIRNEIGDIEGVANSYNNLAIIFESQKRYSKALEYYDKSINIAKAAGNKIGLALYFANISHILKNQNKLDDALLKINDALKINEEIGDKAGIGQGLEQMGIIFIKQNKFKEGISKLEESLKVREEIGNKKGMANSYSNIGSFYFVNEKNYHLALTNFFKSYDLVVKIENKMDQRKVFDWINAISETIGVEKFNDLAKQVYSELDSETKKNIQLNIFFNDHAYTEFPKVGRNDPCPCGSGEKYKNCHGAN